MTKYLIDKNSVAKLEKTTKNASFTTLVTYAIDCQKRLIDNKDFENDFKKVIKNIYKPYLADFYGQELFKKMGRNTNTLKWLSAIYKNDNIDKVDLSLSVADNVKILTKDFKSFSLFIKIEKKQDNQDNDNQDNDNQDNELTDDSVHDSVDDIFARWDILTQKLINNDSECVNILLSSIIDALKSNSNLYALKEEYLVKLATIKNMLDSSNKAIKKVA